MKPDLQDDELAQLIAEEKRLLAEEHFCEAWEAALSDGIEPEILTEAFAARLLRKLTAEHGHEAAVSFIEQLKEKNTAGRFFPERVLQ